MNFLLGREKRKHSLDVQIAREDEFSGRLSNRANFRSILETIFFVNWILIYKKILWVRSSVGDPWHFGADPDPRDPYFWLMDADPTPDPTPFFSDFKNAKKNFIFFSYNLPEGTFSLKNLIFLLHFCVKILLCKHYFSLHNTFMRKGKDPDPYLWLLDPDPRSPKTCGSGSGSPTLARIMTHEAKVDSQFLFLVFILFWVRIDMGIF